MKPQSTQVGGSHYKNLAIQPVEFCQRNKLGYCESSVIKHVCRHKQKNGRQDIEKAIHFLNLLLEMEYPASGSVATQHPFTHCSKCGEWKGMNHQCVAT